GNPVSSETALNDRSWHSGFRWMNSTIRFGLALAVVGMVAWAARQTKGLAGRSGAAEQQPAVSARGAAEEQGQKSEPAESADSKALSQQPGAATAAPLDYDPELIKPLTDGAKSSGDSRRGAMLFVSSRFACVSCHRVGEQGGIAGPELTNIG